MAKSKVTYDELFTELREIVEEIENKEVSVDELSRKVRRASEIIEACKSILTKTENEVEKILGAMKKSRE